jgi:CheY-like chemotaxis protein
LKLKAIKKTEFLLLLVGTGTVLVGILLADQLNERLNKSINVQVELTQRIGEIMRLDEVLSMSARLSVATNDLTYRDRYFTNVDHLTNEIEKAKALVPLDAIISAIRNTDEANNRLIQMEEKAFSLCAKKRCLEAQKLLHSPEYQRDKEIYAGGMSQAFARMTDEAKSNTTVITWYLLLLQLASIVNCVIVVWFVLRLKSRLSRIEIEDERHQAFRSTMDLLMDYFNNVLNKGIMFQERMRELKGAPTIECNEIEHTFREAARRLVDISANTGLLRQSIAISTLSNPTVQEPLVRPEKFRKTSESKAGRVLIVEDDLVNQKMLSSLLQKNQFHVSLANDGAEGLKALASEQFDLVLMDIQMPVMDGIEALRAIRGSEGRWRNVPVIAVTGHAAKGDQEKLLSIGFDGYSPKPVSISDLLALMNTILEERTKTKA